MNRLKAINAALFSRKCHGPATDGNRSGPALVVLLGLGLLFPTLLQAGEITLLTPKEGSHIYARQPETYFVLKLSDRTDLKKLKLRQGDISYEPFSVKPGKQGILVHYRVGLVQGKNLFEIEPGAKRIKLKYSRLRSLLAVHFNAPNVFMFHKDTVVPETCAECHNEKATADVKGLKPFYGDFSPLCYSCHKESVVRAIWLHSPAANVLCRTCHQPEGKKDRVVMFEGRIDALCFRCHFTAAKWPKMPHVHGPVGTGDCTVCHDPHGDRYEKQLWADGHMNLCLKCHIDKRMYGNGGSVKYVHGILEGKGCTACHSPHASENRYQLYKPINELCSSCHTKIVGKKDHPVKNHPLSGKPDPRRKGRELGCTSCHSPHGSQFEFMLIDSRLGNKVCRQCHKNR